MSARSLKICVLISATFTVTCKSINNVPKARQPRSDGYGIVTPSQNLANLTLNTQGSKKRDAGRALKATQPVGFPEQGTAGRVLGTRQLGLNDNDYDNDDNNDDNDNGNDKK